MYIRRRAHTMSWRGSCVLDYLCRSWNSVTCATKYVRQILSYLMQKPFLVFSLNISKRSSVNFTLLFYPSRYTTFNYLWVQFFDHNSSTTKGSTGKINLLRENRHSRNWQRKFLFPVLPLVVELLWSKNWNTRSVCSFATRRYSSSNTSSLITEVSEWVSRLRFAQI